MSDLEIEMGEEMDDVCCQLDAAQSELAALRSDYAVTLDALESARINVSRWHTRAEAHRQALDYAEVANAELKRKLAAVEALAGRAEAGALRVELADTQASLKERRKLAGDAAAAEAEARKLLARTLPYVDMDQCDDEQCDHGQICRKPQQLAREVRALLSAPATAALDAEDMAIAREQLERPDVKAAIAELNATTAAKEECSVEHDVRCFHCGKFTKIACNHVESVRGAVRLRERVKLTPPAVEPAPAAPAAKCDMCHGAGIILGSYDNAHQCPACRGTGKAPAEGETER